MIYQHDPGEIVKAMAFTVKVDLRSFLPSHVLWVQKLLAKLCPEEQGAGNETAGPQFFYGS
jgi:hypothetical protein